MEPIWLENPEHMRRLLPHLQRLVEEQARHGMTVPAIAQRIRSGHSRLWVWGDFLGFFLTQLYIQNTGRLVCTLSHAAGENVVTNQEAILGPIEEYARMHGCGMLEIAGRRGWGRVVRDFGYTHHFTVVAKEL